ELRFSSAGHPSPIWVQRSSGKVNWLRSWDPRHGPALGLFEKATYPACKATLSQNDLILLFTDGLYELTAPDQEEYGQERLLNSVKRHLQMPTDTLLDAVLEDAQRFAHTDEFDDDVCLVAMTAAHVGPPSA
ncbi:MAG TPA: PP2C family protein-serine/threonine phosphatase, partial [Verrucomicrobiae bacterium]|nr:PP2C family protein-serine/threonine phosphatase [Verrucomicrobiae bacterium]